LRNWFVGEKHASIEDATVDELFGRFLFAAQCSESHIDVFVVTILLPIRT
jgi:hypothetical protein